MIYYAKSTRGFYDESIHGTFGAPDSLIPADAVEVTEDEHAALLTEQTQGKEIVPDADGRPIAQVPQFTDTELANAARADRDQRLAATDWTQLGDVPAATVQKWSPYRQALRDLPTQPGFPRTIVWPVLPA